MAVSSKSIIHYTDSLKNITGIIEQSGFRLKYCLETIVLQKDELPPLLSAAFPMVSFCDLPLTLAKEHILSYGSYGIGLSKDWAKRNHLNPVLYVEYDSVTSEYIKEEGDRIGKLRKKDESFFLEERTRFTKLVGFCKNHEGPLIRKGKLVNPNYIFYNEREWRYLPNKEILGDIPLSLPPRDYADNRDDRNAVLADTYLHFGYDDISYIIVKSDTDISTTVNAIRTRYEADGIPAIKLNSLYTKILTVEQIENDF